MGLLISVLLSFLLSKTMIIPIERLTEGAERVASGDFGSTIGETLATNSFRISSFFRWAVTSWSTAITPPSSPSENSVCRAVELEARRRGHTLVRSYGETLPCPGGSRRSCARW